MEIIAIIFLSRLSESCCASVAVFMDLNPFNMRFLFIRTFVVLQKHSNDGKGAASSCHNQSQAQQIWVRINSFDALFSYHHTFHLIQEAGVCQLETKKKTTTTLSSTWKLLLRFNKCVISMSINEYINWHECNHSLLIWPKYLIRWLAPMRLSLHSYTSWIHLNFQNKFQWNTLPVKYIQFIKQTNSIQL